MKIAIHTLGCKVNQSESAALEGILRNNNHEIVRYNDNPDVCIINTCTVTAKSEQQARQLIRKFIKTGAKVFATGCYAQLRPDELSRIEGLTYVIGNSDKDNLVSFLRNISDEKNPDANPEHCGIAVTFPAAPLILQPYFSSKSRAFLKIQDGCNFSCTYCAVPLARGESRSLTKDDVLEAARRLAADGYRELVLTGVHIGSYGREFEPQGSLLDIVEALAGNHPDIRIRLSSLEPQEFSDRIMELIRSGSVCPHLHIPLQSGSNKILKAMNRGYSTESFEQLINNIITAFPDISIGTDVITGFPGENEKDFYDTVNFINRLPFSYLHVFPYSRRPDTKASQMVDHVSEKVKKDRVSSLIELGKMKLYYYKSKHLGSVLDVIVENKSENNSYYTAISDNYLKVFVNKNNIKAGERLKVRVISLTDDGLITEPLV